MGGWFTAGRILFAGSLMLMGAEYVFVGHLVWSLPPLPAWLPRQELFAYGLGTLLLVSGGLLLWTRTAAWTAGALLWFFLLGTVVHNLKPESVLLELAARSRMLQDLAFSSAAIMIYARLSGRGVLLERARIGFALLTFLFGMQHLLYAVSLEVFVPAWIGHGHAWLVLTGLAMVVAAVLFVLGKLQRTAAVAEAAMFLGWLLLLHVPATAGRVDSPNEWGSCLCALAMVSICLLMAGSVVEPVSVAVPLVAKAR